MDAKPTSLHMPAYETAIPLEGGDLQAALEHAPDWIAVVSPQGRLVWTNAAWRTATGDRRGKMTAMADIVPPGTFDAVLRLVAAAASGEPNQLVVDWSIPDGVRRIWLSASRLDGQRALLIGRDVTEQEAVAKRCREFERALRLAAETLHAGYWRLDMARGDVVWTPEARKALGHAAGDDKTTLAVFLHNVVPEDAERAHGDIARCASSGGGFADRWSIRSSDGSVSTARIEARVLLDGRGRPATLHGFACPVATGAPGDHRSSSAWSHTGDAATAPAAILGGIAAAVAHDINNPLTYVVGNLDLLEEEIQDDLRSRADAATRSRLELVHEARVGGARVSRIVRGIRVLASDSRLETDIPELADAIELAADLVSGEARRRASLDRTISPLGPSTMGEPAVVRAVVCAVLWATRFARAHDKEQYPVSLRTEGSNPLDPRVVVESMGMGPLDPRIQRILDMPEDAPEQGLLLARAMLEPVGGSIDVDMTPGLNRIVLHFPC